MGEIADESVMFRIVITTILATATTTEVSSLCSTEEAGGFEIQ